MLSEGLAQLQCFGVGPERTVLFRHVLEARKDVVEELVDGRGGHNLNRMRLAHQIFDKDLNLVGSDLEVAQGRGGVPQHRALGTDALALTQFDLLLLQLEFGLTKSGFLLHNSKLLLVLLLLVLLVLLPEDDLHHQLGNLLHQLLELDAVLVDLGVERYQLVLGVSGTRASRLEGEHHLVDLTLELGVVQVSEEGVRDGRIHIPKRVVIDMHKKQNKSCTKKHKSGAPKNENAVHQKHVIHYRRF